MRECKVEQNTAQCACTYPGCSRKGICCECIRYHWDHGELPGCLFPPEVEKTYDRSLQRFLALHSKR
jgi:hypothetical protein